ncbi:MAG: hypothetical protein K0Q72_5167, partial [Armatimonadetes bacterium]|nr:hypothetical protein [Armatimonadota bacterium]
GGAAAGAAMGVGLWGGGNWAVSLGPVAAPPAWKAAARARPQPAAPAPEPVFEPVADDTPRELAGPPEPTERDLLEQARAAEAAERWEEATDYYGKAWARAVEAKKEALEGIQRSAEAAGNTTTARDAAEHLAADSTRKEMR